MTQSQLAIASLILQRNPITLRTLIPFERVYMEYSEAVKTEKSKGYFSISSDSEDGSNRNVNAFGIPKLPEVYNQKVQLEANEVVNDIKRCPDRKLYLLVNSRNGWQFPAWTVAKDEAYEQPLRTFVESRCQDYFKGDAELYWTGSAPVSHHLERFSDRVQPPFGSTHFFFKSQLIQGTLMVPDEYRWATSDEIKTLVKPGYWGAVKDVVSY